MKQVLVLLLSTLAVSLGWDAGLRVRFGLDPGYVKLPMTLPEAQSKNWTKEERVDKVLPSLVMYCDPTFIICILYDDTQYAAGLQIALPETEFKDGLWDWDTQGYIKWTASNGKSYWTKQQYYVNEAYLAKSQSERVASRDPSSLLSAGGSVWVSGNRAELFEVTKQPDSLLANGFTEQGCVPGMGHHYYRLNETTPCDSEMFPWFTLYDRSRNLVGTGLRIAGNIDSKGLASEWLEVPPKFAVWTSVPRGPSCLYDIADNPGYLSLHIWYVSKPYMNLCWF